METRTEEHIFDSTLESVDAAEAIVLKGAKELGFDEDDEHKIGISVRECMVNAVVHGNRYNSRKKVHLALTRSPGSLEITIADEGEHFDVSQLPDPLATGRNYYWRARAEDGANVGAYSSVIRFTAVTPSKSGWSFC